jgi:hypothetical protein
MLAPDLRGREGAISCVGLLIRGIHRGSYGRHHGLEGGALPVRAGVSELRLRELRVAERVAWVAAPLAGLAFVGEAFVVARPLLALLV